MSGSLSLMNQFYNLQVVHSASDPHDGLALFGPYGQGTAHHCSSPPYIVVGTPFGLNLWDAWSGMMNRSAAVTDQDSRLWPPYPGFEVAFGSRWHEQPERRFAIDRDILLEASRKRDPAHERCFAVVEYFLQHFRHAIKLDMKPAVANMRHPRRTLDELPTGVFYRQPE